MLVGLCFSMSANAADKTNETANATWTFMAVSIKPTAEELAAADPDADFGKEAACLFEKLQNLCVKRVPVVPGDPTTRIVFSKGDIFKAVRRIGKGLEDDVKDKNISGEDASKKMTHVLNVALAAYYSEDSKSFEKALRTSKKDHNKLLAVFRQGVTHKLLRHITAVRNLSGLKGWLDFAPLFLRVVPTATSLSSALRKLNAFLSIQL